MHRTHSIPTARKGVLLLLVLCWAPVAAGAGAPSAGAFSDPNAVVLNVTESDLNAILAATFAHNGGPRFEGHKRAVSRGVFDLSYHAEVSPPVLTLGDGGAARVTLGVREAELRIGRLERRVLHRTARCEEAGMRLDRSSPIDVRLDMTFLVEDHDLQLVPSALSLSAAGDGFELLKPERCTNAPMPRWLLWWLGKPYLRRYIDRLDDVLLAKVQRSASRLNDGSGLLHRHWQVASVVDDRRTGDLVVYPTFLDTSQGSLFVNLAGSIAEADAAEPAPPAERPEWTDRSYIGISERFLNAVLAFVFSSPEDAVYRPGGQLRRVLEGDSVYALVPGLRGRSRAEAVEFIVRFQAPPRIEFGTWTPGTGSRRPAATPGAGAPATVRIELSAIEVAVREATTDGTGRLLGALEIESGSVRVLPYVNDLGGISFDLLDNEWKVSSSGIEFNEPLLEAMLQEIVFGETFESTYAPLAREGLDVGHASFRPRYFSRAGDYLVVELERSVVPADPAAPSLQAKR